MYVSPMPQLPLTGRLCLRDVCSISGKKRIDHRLIVEWHAALAHHLLKVPVAQRISGVPANANQDHIHRETHSFEAEHGKVVRGFRRHSLPNPAGGSANATETTKPVYMLVAGGEGQLRSAPPNSSESAFALLDDHGTAR